MNAAAQRLEAEHRRDLAEIKREAASKQDMQSMEARWNNTTARLEGKMDRVLESMDVLRREVHALRGRPGAPPAGR